MSRRTRLACIAIVLMALLSASGLSLSVASASTPDQIPPVLLVQGVSDGAVYGAPISPQVTSADADLAILWLTLDGGGWTSGSLIGAGRHTIAAIATDTSGNSTLRSIHFTVDTVAPVLYFLVPTPESVDVGSSDKEIVYMIELGDDLSGIDTVRSGLELRSPGGLHAQAVTPLTLVSGDPAGARGNFSQTFRIPKNSQAGIWVPYFEFYDLAGHIHDVDNSCDLLGFGGGKNVVVSNTTLTADEVVATIVAVTPDRAVAGDPITLTATATDSLDHSITTYEWWSSIDGVLGTSSTPLFATTELSAGTHRIFVRARCASGTWSDADESGRTVVVSAASLDSIAPITSCDAQSAYLGSATITLTAMDLYGSGVAHIYYTLDGGPQTEGTSVTTTITGSHALTFWSVDRADNAESPTTLSFTVAAPWVAARVGTPIAPSSVRRGSVFKVYGYVSPAHAAGTYLATLKCYRYQHDHWVLRKTVSAKRYAYSSSASKYSASFSLAYAGRWRIRAYHSDALHTAAYSGYDYVTVR